MPHRSLTDGDPPRMPNATSLWEEIKLSVNAWLDDYAPSMGAALAYYTTFSIAPLLLIVIATAGYFFGQDAVRGEIVAQLRNLIGQEGAVAIEGLIKSASHPEEGLAASMISVVLLVVGATTVFAELQSALDRIWKVPASSKEGGIWTLLRARVLSFGLILGLGFMSLVSLVVSAGLAAFGAWWGSLIGRWELLLQILNFAFSLCFSALLFAMIYRFMPRATIAWRDVWTGAAVTAVLFEIGKFALGIYLGRSGMTSAYGAAGSLVVLLIWVYYSAQIFLLGAEFTWVHATRRIASQPAAASNSATAKLLTPL